jgi:hypothetical protein
MDKPYSLDLRGRIIGFVEGVGLRRDAANRFGVGISCAVNIGGVEPDRRPSASVVAAQVNVNPIVWSS